jgi:hypothetical protein
MKLISRPLFGFFAAVTGGAALIVSISLFTSWGKDILPGFTVSSTPINRAAGTGNS